MFRGVKLDDPDVAWRCYRQPEDSVLEGRTGHSMLASYLLAKLYRISHEAILLYCGAHGPVSAPGLLKVWERFIDFKQNLPSVMHEPDEDPEPLPHVLALQ